MTKGSAARKLQDALVTMALRGIPVKPHNFHHEGHVCLCGAVLAATGMPLDGYDFGLDGEEIIRRVARRLGITIAQAASLNNGFEGEPITAKVVVGASGLTVKPNDRKWYTIGKTIRRQYQKAQRAP
jgi:hypothetical protein